MAFIGLASVLIMGCGGGPPGATDTGTGRPDPAGSPFRPGDSASAKAFAVHSADCAMHARAITDSADSRNFESDCLQRAQSVTRAGVALAMAGQMVMMIPEYHDEQAFPVSADEYGPVARFFASPYLGTITEEWQVDEMGVRGMLAAIIDVDSPDPTLPQRYADLGLKGGINCLWLARAGGNWKAYVSQTGAFMPCDTTGRVELAVIERRDDPGHVNYPAVTRFTEAAMNANGDLDPNTPGQPLLSVRCIDQWCEIGPQPGAGMQKFHRARPMAGTASREHRIKGWHDEQWLALKNGNKLDPAFRAAFVPAHRVNERSATGFDRIQWTTVATVVLSANPPVGSKYETLGLTSGRNILEIRLRGGTWEGRWSYPGGGTKPVKIVRIDHYDAAVPGTARFRWEADDDSFWAPCGQACCRVSPII